MQSHLSAEHFALGVTQQIPFLFKLQFRSFFSNSCICPICLNDLFYLFLHRFYSDHGIPWLNLFGDTTFLQFLMLLGLQAPFGNAMSAKSSICSKTSLYVQSPRVIQFFLAQSLDR
jgi:hypothetical protein